MRERFLKPNKITTLTVIWARQLVSPQPKLGPVPYPREPAPINSTRSRGERPCGEASEPAIAVLHLFLSEWRGASSESWALV